MVKLKVSDVEFYAIGGKTWNRGLEVTITSEPYTLYGGEWQDGINEDGKKVTLATPRQDRENVKKTQESWKDQQAQFRNLKS